MDGGCGIGPGQRHGVAQDAPAQPAATPDSAKAASDKVAADKAVADKGTNAVPASQAGPDYVIGPETSCTSRYGKKTT